MSSFRTLFFITLTLFAALTWAVPVKGPNSAALSQHSDSVNGATILDLEVMDFQEHHQTHHRNTHQSLRRDIPSLCEVLVEVGQKLAVVSNKMTSLTPAEATKKADKVDVNLVVQLTSEVEAILSGTAANVKALVGRPMEFILLLHGKTQSKAEASSLLVNVINLVCAILARAARFAAAASAKVIINAGYVRA
ncbi:hypothetical protein H0H81_003357 [Sphagnurus paluster]|uniref:Uncharacterized protein n=1 Tax=Sphagnurus paluster TaxID=117069 RepID=A0A9P7KJP0_9AGAR|nr:hypothetical protein H0H81_003357 [Sphagnurus paluster]